MKSIHKLVLKSYLGPMILTFFIVMFVLMMNFVWRYIDELVGKGLSAGIIIELMSYAMANMIPMGLPLSMLLAAIMTMGSLGENYELLAMKSAGMSLVRITKPLIILVGFIAVGSFFIGNDLVPYANRKMYSIIYDIRQQKQTLEFQDGLFFNGIDNMSIRVGHQDPETHLLRDVLIYDNRQANGNMNTIVADSGYIRLSDDKRYLLVTLFHGQTYEQARNSQWYTKSTLRHHTFDLQKQIIRMDGFAMGRSDANQFSNSQTKDISELQHDIDSLELKVNAATTSSYEPLLKEQIFVRDNSVLPQPDSLRVDKRDYGNLMAMDSIARLPVREKEEVWDNARTLAKNSRNMFAFDETTAKDALNQLYRSKVEWHKKISLPVSIIIFFLIGAPLGAIIAAADWDSRSSCRSSFRNLLHHQPLGREARQGGKLGCRLRHVALDLHPHADRRLPDLQGDQRLVAARHGLVCRQDQGRGGEARADVPQDQKRNKIQTQWQKRRF